MMSEQEELAKANTEVELKMARAATELVGVSICTTEAVGRAKGEVILISPPDLAESVNH